MVFTRRRAIVARVVAVLAVVLAAGGALAWFVWLPSYRPGLEPGQRYGIDVSGHQGAIDWTAVARDHVSFVYIKATQGTTFVDPRFAANLAGAESAGLARGAYHFFSLCSTGIDQARNFLKTAPPSSMTLPPAVDLELPGNCSERPPRSQVQAQLSAFLAAVEAATGQPVVLYIGASFERAYPVAQKASSPLWVPRFLLRPAGSWFMWQVDGLAHLNGISGDVDLDIMAASEPRAHAPR
jgi:lysozyme